MRLRYAYHEVGYVRNSLLGREPKDREIFTSATPDDNERIFQASIFETIDTVLKHGIVTVKADKGDNYEATTFRIDGNYSDSRHMDSVELVDSIYMDLSGGDFIMLLLKNITFIYARGENANKKYGDGK